MQWWLMFLAGSVLVMSGVTSALYAWDKRRAVRQGWRVPEKHLHWGSLLGGWPGAVVAQRWLRHKTMKRRFRIVFWLTVAGHVGFAAAGTYLAWGFTVWR